MKMEPSTLHISSATTPIFSKFPRLNIISINRLSGKESMKNSIFLWIPYLFLSSPHPSQRKYPTKFVFIPLYWRLTQPLMNNHVNFGVSTIANYTNFFTFLFLFSFHTSSSSSSSLPCIVRVSFYIYDNLLLRYFLVIISLEKENKV